MTSPFPGFSAPNPRTWSAKDLISIPRLRGDMTNMAALMTYGRPMLNMQQASGATTLPTSTVTPIGLQTVVLNNWNVPAVVDPVTPQPNYTVPFAGWYLCQGTLEQTNQGAGNNKYVTGIQAVQNSATTNSDGASVSGNAAGAATIGGGAAELFQLNPLTIDTVALYGYQNSGITNTLGDATLTVEWVALPSQSSGFGGPYGTVVASPAAAANFPSGQGTYITNGGGITAGATSMTVNDATGMVVNGTIGLDYINGQQFTNTAEAVTITSVTGTTIGISATSYAHLQNAPVAVPVSYAFLNQQCRDVINFLAYPPMLRMQVTTTQSVPGTGFPPTPGSNPSNQIIHLSTATGGIDNFSGVAGSSYTIQVAGTYFVYGQVYLAGSSSLFGCSAGISVNSGTIQWGDLMRVNTSGVIGMCPVVRRLLRLSAGDVLTLWGYTSTTMNTVNSATSFSRLIALFRSF